MIVKDINRISCNKCREEELRYVNYLLRLVLSALIYSLNIMMTIYQF